MSKQLVLSGVLDRKLTPDKKRKEPVIWFRELALLRKLESGDTNEIRRIRLHRGLNIIWAPPEDPDTETKLYGDGLSGHASGKTLFCRILRFLLGEANYGTSALTKAVDDHFKEAWAVAEVMVQGQLWLTARPLASQLRRFAIKNCTIDRLLSDKPTHGRFDDFTEAIEEAACAPFASGREGSDSFRWRYLEPWLTRDQECRFAALTEWRNSLSEAENPLVNVTAQQDLMRAVLGMLADKEQEARMKLAEAEATAEKAKIDLPQFERLAKSDRRRVLTALRRAEMQISDDESLTEIATRRTKRLEGLQEALELAEKDKELTRTRKEWDDKFKARSELVGRITQVTSDRDQARKSWREAESKRQRLREQGLTNPARAEAGFCPKTLKEAVERKCFTPPTGASLETTLNLGEILSEADVYKRQFEQKETQLKSLESEKTKLFREERTAQSAYESERKRVDKDTSKLRRLQAALEETEDLLTEGESSEAAFEQTQKTLDAATKAQETLKAELRRLRKKHESAETHFSDLFADVVRGVMGAQVKASAALSDRGILLRAERNGDLTGAALETIKVIAFDLAAVASSVEGRGDHPRFLIHDGPREADMARVIYERFFLYAQKMEQALGSAENASFQYIVTTTTPPPKNMRQGSSWLRLVLNTAKTDERLLKADL